VVLLERTEGRTSVGGNPHVSISLKKNGGKREREACGTQKDEPNPAVNVAKKRKHGGKEFRVRRVRGA